MKKSLKEFVHDQREDIPEVSKVDLSGQTVVVVGANAGLGFEATKHFATMNPARLILACRNETKGKAAVLSIEQKTGYKKAEVWLIDLSNLSSVVAFVEKFENDGGRLDILVMNAGIMSTIYEATSDGWESTVQVNHLATVLVSLLLIPSLLKTGNESSKYPRLVVVSSEMHYWCKIENEVRASPKILEKLSDATYCTSCVMRNRYPVSKLLNILFVRALNAHLLNSAPLIVDTVNPGYCYSEIRRQMTFPMSAVDWLMEKALAHTTEEGSRQLVYAAIGGQGEDMRGQYISGSKVREVSDFVLSAEGMECQERVWNETIEILSQVSPKIRSVVDQYLTNR